MPQSLPVFFFHLSPFFTEGACHTNTATAESPLTRRYAPTSPHEPGEVK
jgi:hypothetical protein